MRILFGHQRFGAQAFGGITRYFVELATALNRLESVRAEVFSPLHVSEFLDPALLSWPGGRRVPQFWGAGAALGVANLAMAKLLPAHAPGYNIYHETYYSRFDCAPRGTSRVVTVFDMIHELFPGDFSALNQASQSKVRSVARADHIICISSSTQSDLVRLLGVPLERTSVVHLGSSLAHAPRAPVPQSNEQPFILYVGQRAGYKNFERMLRAYAASASLRNAFRIVCFGGGPLTPHERDVCLGLGLADGTVRQYSGHDDALASAYARAAMLVYPSLYEGFGLPPLEAMSLECPVVCSDTSSMPEVVGDAGQYFDPLSIDSMRHAMEIVAGSPSRRAELASLGLERARAFSWSACAEKTLKAYQAVSSAARAPSLP